MKYGYDLGQNEFDALLGLFSANREEAGERYEQIRSGLVRFFGFKGCTDPTGLADETINRVARKLHTFDSSKNTQPVSFFYGFASNILLEYRRKIFRESELVENRIGVPTASAEEDTDDAGRKCLYKCLEELPLAEKELVIEYYSCDRQERIELRQKMCGRFQCTAAALYTRVFRIKSTLKDCIVACTSGRV